VGCRPAAPGGSPLVIELLHLAAAAGVLASICAVLGTLLDE
jgi:hypothetical protein